MDGEFFCVKTINKGKIIKVVCLFGPFYLAHRVKALTSMEQKAQLIDILQLK